MEARINDKARQGEDSTGKKLCGVQKREKHPSKICRGGGFNHFETMALDLVISIISIVASSASKPMDFVNLLLVCKMFYRIGLHPVVLATLSPNVIAVKFKDWSEPIHRFLSRCAAAGNAEACYTLGMIEFYCLQKRTSGSSLIRKAAKSSHTQALYSLAVIQFNFARGSFKPINLDAAITLCKRAANLGHPDALRELGHCLLIGYGIPKNTEEGRRLIIMANCREVATITSGDLTRIVNSVKNWLDWNAKHGRYLTGQGAEYVYSGCPLLSYGSSLSVEAHTANRFLVEWFKVHNETTSTFFKVCSNRQCGRIEIKIGQFLWCSHCLLASYCSHACKSTDWELRHRYFCNPLRR